MKRTCIIRLSLFVANLFMSINTYVIKNLILNYLFDMNTFRKYKRYLIIFFLYIILATTGWYILIMHGNEILIFLNKADNLFLTYSYSSIVCIYFISFGFASFLSTPLIGAMSVGVQTQTHRLIHDLFQLTALVLNPIIFIVVINWCVNIWENRKISSIRDNS